jgi:hypothetical protein
MQSEGEDDSESAQIRRLKGKAENPNPPPQLTPEELKERQLAAALVSCPTMSPPCHHLTCRCRHSVLIVIRSALLEQMRVVGSPCDARWLQAQHLEDQEELAQIRRRREARYETPRNPSDNREVRRILKNTCGASSYLPLSVWPRARLSLIGVWHAGHCHQATV